MTADSIAKTASLALNRSPYSKGAEKLAAALAYPAWTQTYSNEDFDRAQALAVKMTDRDRSESRNTPAGGYSLERYNEAVVIVNAAKA